MRRGSAATTGAFFAAVILGLADSFAVNYAPGVQPYVLYIVVVVLLLARPRGLMGSIRHVEA